VICAATVKRWCCLAAFAVALTGCMAAQPEEPTRNAAPNANLSNVVPGEFIVTVKSSVTADQVRRIYAVFGVTEIRDFGGNRFLLRLMRDPGLDRVRSTGLETGQIVAVQPNYVYRTR